MVMKPIEQKIWDMIEPAVADEDLQLVRVQLSGSDGNQTLQIMIEPVGAGPDNRLSVSLGQCETVSRQISALMDVEDPLDGRYRLEVSSTGMERPLVLARDFAAYAGCAAKIEFLDVVGGQKKFEGVLAEPQNGQEGRLEINAEQAIDFMADEVRKARLILTDEDMKKLLNATR